MAAPSSRPSRARAWPGTEHAGGQPAGDQRGQPQQAQGVGDLGPGAADAGGQLLVRAAEVVEQLLVGRRLLERVELAAVEVLQEGVAQQASSWVSLMMAGMVSRPARSLARSRRSPMMSSKRTPCVGVRRSAGSATRRTTTGCSTPISRIDAASSASSSSSKTVRGCLGFGRMAAIGQLGEHRAGHGRQTRAPASRSAAGSVIGAIGSAESVGGSIRFRCGSLSPSGVELVRRVRPRRSGGPRRTRRRRRTVGRLASRKKTSTGRADPVAVGISAPEPAAQRPSLLAHRGALLSARSTRRRCRIGPRCAAAPRSASSPAASR